MNYLIKKKSSMKTDLVFIKKKNVLENMSFQYQCYASFCLFSLPKNLMKLDQILAEYKAKHLGPVSRKCRNFSGTFRVTIVFVSSKRTGFETGNFAVILIFIPFTTYEKTSFTELRMAFRARKVDFSETSPRGRN